MKVSRSLFVLLLGVGAAACDLAPSARDSCAFARDGVCDEPANCALGTDETDCRDACDGASHLLGAACAFRSPRAAAPRAAGTRGDLHLTGHRDGALVVPSGVDGAPVDRHFRLYVPETYRPERPAPLLLVMAGHRVDHYGLAASTELLRTADGHGALVAYVEQEWRWDTLRYAWWTDWTWASRADEHPDVTLLVALTERLGAEYNVDDSRVFTAGHSRGASLALIAALERPDVFAGAVVQSGFTEWGYDERLRARAPGLARRPTLYFVHGVQDPDVCIDCTEGGTCGVQPGRACGDVEGSDSLVGMLRAAGFGDDELVYRRLEGVTHRWQPELNEVWWARLAARPIPAEVIP